MLNYEIKKFMNDPTYTVAYITLYPTGKTDPIITPSWHLLFPTLRLATSLFANYGGKVHEKLSFVVPKTFVCVAPQGDK